MKNKELPSQFHRQVDHFEEPIQARFPYSDVTVYKGNIGRAVKAETCILMVIIISNIHPFGFCQIFRKQPGKIEAELYEIKSVFRSEIGDRFQITGQWRGCETDPPAKKPLDSYGQVFLSFFLAAGNNTLFNINLYPGECLCKRRLVGGSPIIC